jgi:hypothetical protein
MRERKSKRWCCTPNNPSSRPKAVPVERVRLGTETVTEEEAVAGTVRKEQIEVDDDTPDRGTPGRLFNR